MPGVRRWVPLVAIAVVLGAAMLAALYANPVVQARPFERVTITPTPGASRGDGTDPDGLTDATASPGPLGRGTVPVWLTAVTLGVFAAMVAWLLAALVWVALWQRFSQRARLRTVLDGDEPQTLAQARESVRGALDAGLSDLDDADTDPRRTVIACWVRLEEAAAAAGVPREPADTSTDLVRRLLARFVVSAPVLSGLAATYREARYGTHVVDEAMRGQARAALQRLRAELVPGRPPAPAVRPAASRGASTEMWVEPERGGGRP